MKTTIDLDQLKTSLSAVKDWTSDKITNATKDKADKDIVLLKDNTTEYIPTADYNPSTKKYVDDKITEVSGEYISTNGGEYEYKSKYTIKNALVNTSANGTFLSIESADANMGGITYKYEYDFPYQGGLYLGRNKKDDSGNYVEPQAAIVSPYAFNMLDDSIDGDHKKTYILADRYWTRRYNNGWQNFYIQSEKDRTLIYNDQKLIDFNDSRLENVGTPTDDTDAATKKYADTESKVAKRFIFDSDDNIIGVKIKDQVNNYNYILCMRNGTLATTCAVKSISITTNPTKMTYTAGSTIDTTGMVVTATCEDNTTREITGYTCTNTVTADNPKFTISYTEGGTTCTTELTVTVSAS